MPSATSGRFVVAVSGGIDSVVLLDALCKQRTVGKVDPAKGQHISQIIVAHFDHGIRSDSAEDAAFVRKLAETYECEYRTERKELGAKASEELARHHRYTFLAKVCHEFDAMLVTAHHANDVAETIAINIERGTGWRGVAVMDNVKIWRPLLNVTKKEIHQYAKVHDIAWHEDSTNISEKYLRNRIRKKLNDDDLVLQLLSLRARQVELKHMIDEEARVFTRTAPYSRYFFGHCGDEVAIELLRSAFMHETGSSPTIVVRKRVLHAIKVAKEGTTTHVANGVSVRFTKSHFIVENTDKVLS